MSIDLLATISVAFFSSFGHCYFMCGGFNIAFAHINNNNFYLTLIYHLFRILAYVFLAYVFFYFKSFFIDEKIQNLILFVLGNLMVFLGFALIIRGRILNIIENNFIFDKFMKNLMKKAMKLKGIKSAILLGFLNGFVPCGIVYFFIINSISQDNVYNALLIMLIFGISTLPTMLLFFSACEILNNYLKKIFNYFSYFLIICYGIYISFNAFLNI